MTGAQKLQQDREAIERKLAQNRDTEGAYAEAFGEMKVLCVEATSMLAATDPAYGLVPMRVRDGYGNLVDMSYQDIVSREA
jgi:hypothetical protein